MVCIDLVLPFPGNVAQREVALRVSVCCIESRRPAPRTPEADERIADSEILGADDTAAQGQRGGEQNLQSIRGASNDQGIVLPRSEAIGFGTHGVAVCRGSLRFEHPVLSGGLFHNKGRRTVRVNSDPSCLYGFSGRLVADYSLEGNS